ncbi:pyridoxal phosphate-dependent aminotransferase [Candidatus Thorarchaeota archaeon]|nr:MAG: pyridoxal phosphate-dependent aminotransferase [Candidatus Thorarchaeota archaeon]
MKFRTVDIMPPPILKLTEAAKRFVASPDFLDLSQGLPGHIPPDEPLAAVRGLMSHPSTHLYTPNQGLLELREALALYLRQNFGFDINPMDELVITADAKNAFAGTIMTLLEPKENIIMLTPYHFKSAMAIHLAGGKVKEVPCTPSFQIDVDRIAKAIDKDTRGIVLVSPNDPTGAVYDRDAVEQVVDICLEHDLALISDETYSRMVFDGFSHHSPRLRRDATENIIALGSFSKDFGMSGWRVGYVIGPKLFVDEFLKVQDTISICASTAGQLLALEILKNGLDAVELELERLNLLRELAYLRIREIDQLIATRTSGTFYIFPKVKGCKNSRALAMDILQSTGTLVLPGTIFGAAGEGHIRISIGPLTPEAVDEAFDRLGRYFGNA